MGAPMVMGVLTAPVLEWVGGAGALAVRELL
jgi:hypothetical protein